MCLNLFLTCKIDDAPVRTNPPELRDCDLECENPLPSLSSPPIKTLLSDLPPLNLIHQPLLPLLLNSTPNSQSLNPPL